MQNFHILHVEHVPATNNRPAIIKLSSELFKQAITSPYTNQPDSLNPAVETAINILKLAEYSIDGGKTYRKGFDIIGQGESKKGFYLISTTFQPLK